MKASNMQDRERKEVKIMKAGNLKKKERWRQMTGEIELNK